VDENTIIPFGKRSIEGASAAPSFSELKLQVEAVLFAAEGALEIPDIRNLLGDVSLQDVRLALKDLSSDYEERAFFIYENAGKYQLRTKAEFNPILRRQFQSKARNLSKSALETLAIVAYKQPVTRGEINEIRSTDCSSIILSLKEKELIFVSGQRKGLGNPLEYRTTPQFLEVFGLSSLSELPRLRSLQMPAQTEERIAEALKALSSPETAPIPTSEDLAFSPE
jgi:segregation and condensation protein B